MHKLSRTKSFIFELFVFCSWSDEKLSITSLNVVQLDFISQPSSKSTRPFGWIKESATMPP
jgi:hypothetical protein